MKQIGNSFKLFLLKQPFAKTTKAQICFSILIHYISFFLFGYVDSGRGEGEVRTIDKKHHKGCYYHSAITWTPFPYISLYNLSKVLSSIWVKHILKISLKTLHNRNTDFPEIILIRQYSIQQLPQHLSIKL